MISVVTTTSRFGLIVCLSYHNTAVLKTNTICNT